MRTERQWYFGMAAVAFAVLLVPASVGLNAQQSNGAAVRIDADDIGGTSPPRHRRQYESSFYFLSCHKISQVSSWNDWNGWN